MGAQTNPRKKSVASGITGAFVRSGPWALLLVMVLVAVWYELDTWMGQYIKIQETYITQGTEGLAQLQKTTDTLVGALSKSSASIESMEEEVRVSREQVREMVGLMREANQLMSGVPDRSKRTLDVLNRIESLLYKLDHGESKEN